MVDSEAARRRSAADQLTTGLTLFINWTLAQNNSAFKSLHHIRFQPSAGPSLSRLIYV